LKWNWSTLNLTTGTTSSCHRCLPVPLDEKNFDNFHNLPHKVKEREIMLSGKWPTLENGGSGHCNYCKEIEDNGGKSDRLNMLEQANQVPPELDKNPRATTVTPKILEIFLNDTCNMKCTYCRADFSSQWRNEIRKFGALTDLDGRPMLGYTPDHKFVKKREDISGLVDKTVDWLRRNGHQLSRLHLLGGETFYQTELDEILDVLEITGHKNLEFNIISNLMVKEERFTSVLERIKKMCRDRKIGRFDLTVSIDGLGREIEYARTGLKCDHFGKLFALAVRQKWMVLHTNSVITSMSVKALPPLIEQVKEHRKINSKISMRINAVQRMPQLHPAAFGRDFWKHDIENILNLWPADDMHDRSQRDHIGSMFSAIKNQDPDLRLVKFFKHYLDQLDKRRNTNWREVFPYLDI